MLDAPRTVRMLLATGLTQSEIADLADLSYNSIGNIENFRSKNAQNSSAEKLQDLLCREYDFPWSSKADVQLREMAAIARSRNPGVLCDLYGYSRETWIESISEARRRSTLSQEEWTELALAYSALLGDLKRKRKLDERYAGELKAAWGMVTGELLKRIGQLDIRNDADRAFVKIFRYDVIQNQITARWELSKMTPADVRNLKEFIEQVDYFVRYEEFNDLLPDCFTTHFNALGIASALKLRSRYKRIWGRLSGVDERYASIFKFKKDKDAGPEFSDFFAWVENSFAIVTPREAGE